MKQQFRKKGNTILELIQNVFQRLIKQTLDLESIISDVLQAFR